MTKNKYGFNFETSYENLPKDLYSKVTPTKLKAPEIIILNDTLSQSLGLNVAQLKKDGEQLLSASTISDDLSLIAQSYSGHQFGHFTTLGDGRALLLGEHIDPNGNRLDIQLKGSGRTPYSRNGDGKASLAPMLREYLISEAMHALNVPTTRALAVIRTGDPVFRTKKEAGAILTRVAKAHIRVGTFQHIGAHHDTNLLKEFTDYTINRLYPDLLGEPNIYQAFLVRVIRTQAQLIAKWQLIGFVHGVMNTDNMSLSGETIDYGPCAFMDTYKINTVFSSIDHQGRYCYGNQPYMAKWNLTRFAETLLPLLDQDQNKALKKAQDALASFAPLYQLEWLNGMGLKLGLQNTSDQDLVFFNELLKILEEEKLDYTNTFLEIQNNNYKSDNVPLEKWLSVMRQRLKLDGTSIEEATTIMSRHNPVIIPRNDWVEDALGHASQGDLLPFMALLEALKTPFDQKHQKSKYQKVQKNKKDYVTYCGT